MPQGSTATRDPISQQLYDGLKALPSSSRLNDAQLETIYALAYAYVTQKRYAQALPVFSILSIYGPTHRHYLAGLALCLEKCERYEEAIGAYSLLIMLFPGDPQPALQVAECQLRLGRVDEAIQELDRVLRCIGESGSRYAALEPRARVLRDLAGRQVSG